MSLIEQARLTEEEADLALDGALHEGRPAGALYRALEEAQLSKALWAVVEWLHEGRNFAGIRAAILVGMLEAAGLERPK